ncbi:hypothetical protein [Vibrio sp. 10N.222.49.C12]
MMLTGCPIDGATGEQGSIGATGPQGATGLDGINCWDTNENRVDDANEDINADGLWDVNDCASVAATSVSQNLSVDLNHQHICEALANLGQYPQGCPSVTHITPNATGDFRQISFMLDDGSGNTAFSCGFPPNNGLLTLEKNQLDQVYYWKLEGGFVASATVIALEDELGADIGNPSNSCLDLCENDPECIASYAESKTVFSGNTRNIVYNCALFHHSDTIQPFEKACDDKLANCGTTSGVLSASQRWAVRCP